MSIYQLAECRYGRFLYNRNDSYVGRSLEQYGEWSDAEVDLFRQILRPGDHVLEAGSNIGSHTVALSQLVGDDGMVHSFEPMRHTHQLLNANLALNECFNVLSYRCAVGRESARISFPIADPRVPNNFGAMSVLNQGNNTTEEIEQVALDTLGLERLDILKADIEGYEFELLSGARDTIRRLRPFVYLEFGPSKDEIIRYFDALNYTCYYYISPMYSARNFRNSANDIFGASSTDLICVPDERGAVTGLTEASVGDGLVSWTDTGINYLVLPHTGCRVARVSSSSVN